MSRLIVVSACIVLCFGLFAMGGRAEAADAVVAPPAPAQAAPAPAQAAPLPLIFLRAKCQQTRPLQSVQPATFLDVPKNPGDIGTIIIVPIIDPLTGCGNCPGVCNSAASCYGKKIGDSCGNNGQRCTADGAGCTAVNCCDCV